MPHTRSIVLQKHIKNIKALQTPRGLFLASAGGPETGYDKAWLRDNFYTALAFEYSGDWETVKKTWRAVLDVLLKHEYKIEHALKERPHESWQYIHARYNPDTFDEYWDEWGNKQNDAVGAVLFKLADLELRGHGVLQSDAERALLQKLIDYLNTIQYWHDPDSGIWEEGEEVHASSLGAVVAALKKAKELSFLTVPDGMIEKGVAAMTALLPRESKSKFADLALLSLLYPFDVVDKEMAGTITTNVAYHLERRRGVIRYKNDRYFNKNEDGYSEEAEWTMGLPWLAVIYSRHGDRERAKQYLEKAKETPAKNAQIPELYFSNSEMPNKNIPLGWAESLFVVACLEYERAFGRLTP